MTTPCCAELGNEGMTPWRSRLSKRKACIQIARSSRPMTPEDQPDRKCLSRPFPTSLATAPVLIDEPCFASHTYFSFTSTSCANAASDVCVAFNPRRKSLSEYEEYRSVA